MLGKIMREDGRTLVTSLEEAIREQIKCGAVRSGDRLPPLRQIAKEADVSLIVVRQAIARLAREGLVVSRRGSAVYVCESNLRHHKGRVVWIGSYGEEFSFYSNLLVSELSRLLTMEGYRFRRTTLRFRRSTFPMRLAVVKELEDERPDLVITSDGSAEMARLLERRQIPYMLINAPLARSRFLISNLEWSVDLKPFVRRCVLQRIHSAVVMCTGGDPDPLDGVVEKLSAAGIDATLWRLKTGLYVGPTVSKVKAMRMMSDRLSEGLPDLFVFADDHVAEGALYALAAEGVQVPRDVKVVSLINRGCNILAPCSLSRFESDYKTAGAVLAKRALEYLSGAPVSKEPIRFSREFIVGRSF